MTEAWRSPRRDVIIWLLSSSGTRLVENTLTASVPFTFRTSSFQRLCFDFILILHHESTPRNPQFHAWKGWKAARSTAIFSASHVACPSRLPYDQSPSPVQSCRLTAKAPTEMHESLASPAATICLLHLICARRMGM